MTQDAVSLTKSLLRFDTVNPPGRDALHNPRYATELHQFSGGTLLEIRHPSLGWMDFILPSVERIRITRSLAEQEEFWKRFRR